MRPRPFVRQPAAPALRPSPLLSRLPRPQPLPLPAPVLLRLALVPPVPWGRLPSRGSWVVSGASMGDSRRNTIPEQIHVVPLRHTGEVAAHDGALASGKVDAVARIGDDRVVGISHKDA